MYYNHNQDEEIVIGHAFVDAGLLWVGDPCYIMGNDASCQVANWKEFCDLTERPDLMRGRGGCSEPLGKGIGFAVRTGWGDGSYPVTITVSSGGPVTSVTVTFDEDDEADEDDQDWDASEY